MPARVSIAAACVFAVLFSAGAAGAVDTPPNTTVISSDYAHDCFLAAEFGTGNAVSCDLALLRPMKPRDRAATFGNRAVLRLVRKDYDGALADCDAGLRVDKTVGDVYLDRGAALIMLNRYDEAISDLDRAAELGARKMHFVYFNRAVAKEEMGDVRGAYEDFMKSLDASPSFQLAQEQLKRFRVTTRPGAAS